MTIDGSGSISAYFNRLIENILTVERRPLREAEQRRDQINVRRGSFTAVSTRLNDLHNAAKGLLSTMPGYSFNAGRKVTISGAADGGLTASAGSAAAVGRYTLQITSLAAAHRVNGSQQTSASAALGLAGTLALNGAAVTIDAGDSLIDIAQSINDASYAAGSEVRASVVDRRLVLENANGGSGNLLAASDVSGGVLTSLGVLSGGAFANVLQTPSNAVFTVNGLPISRTRNTGLDDVIHGITLNLSAAAAGKTFDLDVNADSTPEKTAISAFIEKFNALQSYLEEQTRVEITRSGTENSYYRGPLSGDSVFSDLRSQLFTAFIEPAANAGSFRSLREIGVTIDDNLKASLSDSAKFEAALTNKRGDVVKLLDAAMTKIDTLLGRFTASGSGFMSTQFQSLDTQQAEIASQITDLNSRLSDRRLALTAQYSQMAYTLQLLQYDFQTTSSLTRLF
jgi:flagellar hook-associated protein 2